METSIVMVDDPSPEELKNNLQRTLNIHLGTAGITIHDQYYWQYQSNIIVNTDGNIDAHPHTINAIVNIFVLNSNPQYTT